MKIILPETWTDEDPIHNGEVRHFFLHIDLIPIEIPFFEVNLDDVTADNPASEFLDRIPDDYIESLRTDFEKFINRE